MQSKTGPSCGNPNSLSLTKQSFRVCGFQALGLGSTRTSWETRQLGGSGDLVTCCFVESCRYHNPTSARCHVSVVELDFASWRDVLAAVITSEWRSAYSAYHEAGKLWNWPEYLLCPSKRKYAKHTVANDETTNRKHTKHTKRRKD